MIDSVAAAVAHICELEKGILRVANPLAPDSIGVRGARIAAIRNRVAKQKATMRRLTQEEPLIGTQAAVINSDDMKTILEWCFKKGTPEHRRLAMHLALGTATLMRSNNMESMALNYMFVGQVGDSSIQGLDVHKVLAFLVDRSKTNQTGHKFVTGAVHHLDPIRCPIFWTAVWLVTRFLPFAQGGLGGSYPALNTKEWYETPLMCERDQVDTKAQMSAEKTLAAITEALRESLDLGDAEVLSSKKRHLCRTLGVDTLMSGMCSLAIPCCPFHLVVHFTYVKCMCMQRMFQRQTKIHLACGATVIEEIHIMRGLLSQGLQYLQWVGLPRHPPVNITTQPGLVFNLSPR
jgi:hypothetical protein